MPLVSIFNVLEALYAWGELLVLIEGRKWKAGKCEVEQQWLCGRRAEGRKGFRAILK
jgi:hypothetical protein